MEPETTNLFIVLVWGGRMVNLFIESITRAIPNDDLFDSQ